LNLLAGSIVPGLVQRLFVEPSELARETPYLASNIKLTREAYGLERLQSRSHPALGVLDPQVAAQNQGTVQNVRLWDEGPLLQIYNQIQFFGPLLQIYNQIQFFRLYYDFAAVHTDRYTEDGQTSRRFTRIATPRTANCGRSCWPLANSPPRSSRQRLNAGSTGTSSSPTATAWP